jgi:peroxiredoxin Q/BCP
MLKEGMIAPEFTLPNEKGEEISLSNFRGKKVVLYFYSKNGTPGCTRQACAYAGAYALFEEKNAVVIGISKDSATSHEKFAAKHGLPFLLLADPEKEVHSLYGVLKEKTMYGKKTIGTERTTFLINEEGVLVRVRKKVNPDTDPAEVLALL